MIRRPGVYLSIHEKIKSDGSLEFCVLRGNKILSRHATHSEARVALEMAAKRARAVRVLVEAVADRRGQPDGGDAGG